MPLSARSRQDGPDKERTAKAQEQELKRARGAISCAECRRLKLKCDKTVPCSSCKRRGCASICPNGSLTTGQGTRFILADTDRLHRKIAEMSDRIRQLEDGLAILQSSVTRDPHPLLAQDLLKIKSGLELHSASELALGGVAGGDAQRGERDSGEPEEEPAYIDAFGTLAVRDDGAATFYGRSAGSESLLLDEKPQLSISTLSRDNSGHPDLPPEINRLATTFPHGPPEVAIFELQELVSGYLPPWPRAARLRDLYLEQAPWFFGAVTQRQLHEEVFPLFYEEAAEDATRSRAGGVGASGGVGGTELGSSAEAFNLASASANTSKHASSHELALMFVVFCFGALTDASLPPAPHNGEAERYYQLTRAALSLEPVMDRPPSVATVQVLSLMGIYQGMVADEHSIETTWALMGLSSKLAQSTGLHRDCSRFKLSTFETQKRRALFWELFITDCWQALATGRLPTFELQFVDTELPADPDETLSDDGTPQPSFPAWKARWGKECVSNVVMGTLTAQAPKYSVILDLDRRIRDMPLPKYAQGPPPRNAGLAQTMSHYMPTNYLHLTLLYVHRCFFAHALIDHPTDPMRSQYAPSFLAGYRSASALLGSLREQFNLFPSQIARFWVLWTHAFSACVMLGSVVTRGGTTKTAQAALNELRLALELFERAATQGGRALKFVPIIRKLHEKAQAAYFQGLQPLRRDIFSSRSAETEQDELSIFSGRTARTVATKSNRPQRISPSMSSSSHSPSDMSSPSTTQSGSGSDRNARDSNSPTAAGEVFPGLDSSYRTAVHPGLVAELRSFEGQLDAQISQNGVYYSPGSQGQQQPVYAAQQQHQHQPYPQTQSQPPSVSWYQIDAPGEQQPYSAPSTNMHGSAEQQYQIQYGQQPRASQHSPEQLPEQQHPIQQSMYHQQAAAASHPNLHDIPLYGGAIAPQNASDPAQYQNHPYAHVASGVSSSSPHLPDYAYTQHALPDQHPEMWSASVTSPEGDLSSYATSPAVYERPSHSDSALPEMGQYHQYQHQPAQQHHHHQEQHHYHQHHYQPVANANVNADVPQPLQPQHTGHEQMQHYHPQYVQGQGQGQGQNQSQSQSHGQNRSQLQYGYPQQTQQLMPQQAAPLATFQQDGYSLTETWTSFIQQELPGPPGARIPSQTQGVPGPNQGQR